MNKQKTIEYGAYTALGLLSIFLMSYFAMPYFNTGNVNYDRIIGDSPKYTSNVCMEKITKDGVVVDLGCKHNVLTNGGKTYLEQALTGTATNISSLALGNTTAPAAGETALAGIISSCGLEIVAANYSNNAVGNWSITASWTSTCDGIVVNTTGLYKNSANMFAGTTFNAATMYIGDTLRENYTLSVSG